MYLMERDVVLPPLVPNPSLPQCVATTEFAWDWPHSSSTVVSEVNRAAWSFFCHLDWSRDGQQYPINSTHSVLSAPLTPVLVSGLSNQMKKLLFTCRAKLKWLAYCADVWPRTTGAVVLRETNHTKMGIHTEEEEAEVGESQRSRTWPPDAIMPESCSPLRFSISGDNTLLLFSSYFELVLWLCASENTWNETACNFTI